MIKRLFLTLALALTLAGLSAGAASANTDWNYINGDWYPCNPSHWGQQIYPWYGGVWDCGHSWGNYYISEWHFWA